MIRIVVYLRILVHYSFDVYSKISGIQLIKCLKDASPLINIHRYIIEEYKTIFFDFFWKPCYPLKALNAPKIQKIPKIDFKLENVSSDNTKP